MVIKAAAKRMVKAIAPSVYERYQLEHRMRICAGRAKLNQVETELLLAQMYRDAIGAELNLDNPRRYTEKIQWRKVRGWDQQNMTRLADKYAVRNWVEDRVGAQYLIPLIGVWNKAEDIDFDALPEQYVLKTNNASGTNIIVADGSMLNRRRVIQKMNIWLRTQFWADTFERHYKDISPKIIAEEFIDDGESSDLKDYKFICFDGKPAYIWVDLDRSTHHTRVVFDTDWRVQAWNQFTYPKAPFIPKRPKHLEEMLDLAKRLSKGFDHVRVDLYEASSGVLFGEMTFTNGSGFERIVPDEWDYRLGSMWHVKGLEV